MVDLLIEHGSNVNTTDDYENTLLHSSAVRGLDFSKLFIQSPKLYIVLVLMDSIDIFVGDEEIAEMLIKKFGANVNAVNIYKETPLHEAADHG